MGPAKTACADCRRSKCGAGKYCLACYAKHNIPCPECCPIPVQVSYQEAVIICRRRKRNCMRCGGTGWIEV